MPRPVGLFRRRREVLIKDSRVAIGAIVLAAVVALMAPLTGQAARGWRWRTLRRRWRRNAFRRWRQALRWRRNAVASGRHAFGQWPYRRRPPGQDFFGQRAQGADRVRRPRVANRPRAPAWFVARTQNGR